MGKASRRKRQAAQQGTGTQAAPAAARAPFVARPFEGLAGETEWVALREIVPAGTAPVTMRLPEGEREVLLVSVLPGAVPALHRADGALLVALQSRTSSGDASRDVVHAVEEVARLEPGQPLASVRPATADTARLQDVLAEGQELRVEVHQDFGFWVADEEAAAELAEVLERTNEAAVPTERVDTVPSAFWTTMSGRSYLRWLLPDDEDTAVRALARLQAAGTHTLGEDTKLLGMFRAAGLIVPVLEVPADAEPQAYAEALGELAARYEEVKGDDTPLTPEERRARDSLSSRQVSLR